MQYILTFFIVAGFGYIIFFLGYGFMFTENDISQAPPFLLYGMYFFCIMLALSTAISLATNHWQNPTPKRIFGALGLLAIVSIWRIWGWKVLLGIGISLC